MVTYNNRKILIGFRSQFQGSRSELLKPNDNDIENGFQMLKEIIYISNCNLLMATYNKKRSELILNMLKSLGQWSSTHY